MATIKLKRGTSAPTTSDIADGEVAIDKTAQKLYLRDGSTIKEISRNTTGTTLDLSGALTGTTATFTTADNLSQVRLVSTDADASAGPRLDLFRNSASPAASDFTGRIRFLGEDSAGNETGYAHIDSIISDATDGSEDGHLRIETKTNGTMQNRIGINSSETVFNEDSISVDFRVESDGQANMFFVDAGTNRVGINTNTPDTVFEIRDADPVLTIRDTETSSASGNATLRLAESGASDTLNNYWDIKADGGKLQFIDNWDEGGGTGTRMTIADTGSVGILTDSPIAPLHVAGNAVIESGSPDLYLATTSASHTNWRIAAQEVVNQGFEIASGTTSASSNAVADTYTTRFTIKNDGKVGIGTTAPTHLLHVNGAAKFGSTGPIEVGTNVLKASNTGNNGFLLRSAISSAGNPSFSSVDDTNTGMFLPSGNILGFTTAGGERMRIDGSGNVGIGTTPAQRLHISGGGLQISGNITTPASGTSAVLIDYYQGVSRYWSRGADASTKGGHNFIILEDDGGSQVTALSIGTDGNSTFNGKLQIDSDDDLTDFTSTTNGALLLRNTDYNTGDYTALDFGYSSYTHPIGRIGLKITGSGSYLAFGTSNSYSSGVTNEAMTIDYNGYVGIGDTAPQSNLDISGSSGIFVRHSTGGSLVLDDSDTADGSTPMVFMRNTAGTLRLGYANRNSSTGLTTGSANTVQIAPTGIVDFTNHIDLPDNKYVRLGNAADLILYHNGSASYIQSQLQDGDIHIRGNDGGTNFNALSFDMSNNGAATFNNTVSTGGISVTHSTDNGVNIYATDTTGDSHFSAMRINHDLSGSDTLTNDRIHAALELDVDSSASGGTTSDEHRVYGIYNHTRVTGDSDLVYGGYFNSEAQHGSGQVSAVYGVYGRAEGDATGGTISQTIGVLGASVVGNEAGVTHSNAYGGYFKTTVTAANADTTVGNLYGGYFEVEIDPPAAADVDVAAIYGVHSVIDNDGASSGNPSYDLSDTPSYLYYGNYTGTLPGNAYGLYILDDVPSYIRGNLGINKGSPAYALDVRSTIHITNDAGSGYTHSRLIFDSNGNGRGIGNFYHNQNTDLEWFAGNPYNDSDAFSITRQSTASHADSTANYTLALMTIDGPTGNMGIGLTAPTAKLDVYQNTDNAYVGRFTQDHATGYGVLIDIDSTANGDPALWVKNASDTGLWVSGAGRVGIGTTAPDSNLHVNGNWRLDGIGGNGFYNFTNGVNLDVSNYTSGGYARAYKITTADSSGGIALGILANGTTLTRAYWTIVDSGTDTGYDNQLGITMMKNGDVGVGTNSPGNILEVVDASPIVEINASSGSPELQFSDSGVDEFSIMYDTGANALKFVEGGVGTRVAILDGGNVGIGSTGPVDILDLGNAAAGRGIAWGGTSGTNHYTTIWSEYSSASLILAAGLKGSTSAATFLNPYTGSYGYAAIELDSFSDDGIKFYCAPDSSRTAGATITPVECMRIRTGGDVLIGTTTQVYGSARLNIGSTSDSINAIQIQTSTSGNGYLMFGDGSSADSYRGYVHYNHGSDYLRLRAAGGERMRLNSGGVNVYGDLVTDSEFYFNSSLRVGLELTGTATATVGPGWMSVATNTSGRRHGEIIVTDADSGDHAFIRIDWMRSYADSNFTVLNCGGHSNRITGCRVISQDSNNTYGEKILQVYVTTSSAYDVHCYHHHGGADFTQHSAVTPVIEDTKTGYSLHGAEINNLSGFSLASEEGVQAPQLRTQAIYANTTVSNDIVIEPGGSNGSVDLRYAGSNTRLKTENGGVTVTGDVLGVSNMYVGGYLFHDGDTNTYLRFVAADDMQLVAGGRQMLRMDEGANPDILQFVTSTTYTDSSGNIVASGNITAYASDERLKTNIRPIENAIDKIKAIRGVHYDWIDDVENVGFIPDRKLDNVGVIAQEIEEVLPQVVKPAPFDRERSKETNWEFVSKSGEEYKTVDYDKITALLIQGMKEQQEIIETLEAKIKKLEEELL